MLSSQIPDEFKLGAHPVGYAKEPAQDHKVISAHVS